MRCPHCAAGMPMSAHDGYHWTGNPNPPKCVRTEMLAEAERELLEAADSVLFAWFTFGAQGGAHLERAMERMSKALAGKREAKL